MQYGSINTLNLNMPKVKFRDTFKAFQMMVKAHQNRTNRKILSRTFTTFCFTLRKWPSDEKFMAKILAILRLKYWITEHDHVIEHAAELHCIISSWFITGLDSAFPPSAFKSGGDLICFRCWKQPTYSNDLRYFGNSNYLCQGTYRICRTTLWLWGTESTWDWSLVTSVSDGETQWKLWLVVVQP